MRRHREAARAFRWPDPDAPGSVTPTGPNHLARLARPVHDRGFAVAILVVAVAYALGAQLSWWAFGANDIGLAFFPAAGVSLAALLLLPRRWWPGVLAACGAAELVVDLAHGLGLGVSLGYAVANVVEPWVGASLLVGVAAWPGTRQGLQTLSGAVAFVTCATIAGPLAGGLIGSAVVSLDAGTGYFRNLLQWVLGDGVGVLVFGASFLLIAERSTRRALRRPETVAVAVVSGVVAAVSIGFTGAPITLLTVPVIAWAALRLEVPGVFLSGAIFAVAVNAATAAGESPFSRYGHASPTTQLTLTQAYVGVMLLLGWVVAIEHREQRLARARQTDAEVLARVSLILDRQTTADSGALVAAVTDAVVPSFCDVCTIRLARGRDLELVAVGSVDRDVRDELATLPTLHADDDPSSVGDAARSGRTVLHEFDRSGSGLALATDVQRRLAREQIRMMISAPITGGGELIGVLSFGTLRRTGRAFEPADVALADEFARRCGVVLHELSLRARAELSEARLQALRRAITALAAAVTEADVLEAIGTTGLAALGADQAIVVANDGDHFAMSSLLDDGAAQHVPVQWVGPLHDAVVERRAIVLHDADEVASRWPDYADTIARSGASWAAVPFPPSLSIRGGLWLCYADPQPFDDGQRELLTAFVDSAGQAVERARAHEEQLRRRLESDRRTDLVVALSAAESTGDVAECVMAEGRDAAFADSALLAEVRWNGRVVVRHPAGTDAAVEHRWTQFSLDRRLPMADAIANGRPVYLESCADPPPEYDEVGAFTPELASVAILPLFDDEDQVLGAVRFGWYQPRKFPDEVRSRLAGLAAKVGETIQRVRAQESERLLQYQAEQLALLAAALSATRTRGEVDSVVRGVAPATFGAMAVSLRVLDDDRRALVLEAASVDGLAGAVMADAEDPVAHVARTGESVYVESRDDVVARFPAVAARLSDRSHAYAVLPLAWKGRVEGVLSLVYEQRVPFSEAEKHGLETFATILGQTLERTVLAEHEQRVAMTLQHAMLGHPDEVTSVAVSTSYRPADERLEIGGDWFDVIELANGRVGLVVGDVVGHNVGAAAAMGQLRSALRALAGVLVDPAVVLAALQRLVADEDASRCTTLLYGVLDPASHVLEYCSAGHPPALVVDHAGTATYLMGGRGTPIGSFVSSPPATAVARLAPGSTLVFYTDGLVERRGEVLDVGLERLADCATRLVRDSPGGEDLAERIVDAMLDTGPQDDVAVLVARLDPARLVRRLPAAAPELSQLRTDVREWFAFQGVAPDEAEEMLVAISEAVNNSVEHAYLDRAPGTVTVELEYREPHTVVAVVRDHGTWREGPSPDTRGRGLSLMRALSTAVDVVHGDEGAEIRLVRRFRVLEPV